MESGHVDTDDQGSRSEDSQGQLAIAPEAIAKPNTHIVGAASTISRYAPTWMLAR